MYKFVFKLGEFSGSNFLEFQKKSAGTEKKFYRQDSLYVLDDAFFQFLELIFREVIDTFDMFEDTCVSKSDWQKIMCLNISEIILPEFVDMVKETLCAIDRWVQEEIGEGEEFIAIGV